MGAFDTTDTYNSSQPRISVVWIVITAIFGCVFIAKKLYFADQAKRLGKNNVIDGFIDIIIGTILCLILLRFVYGPPNTIWIQILMIFFMLYILSVVGKIFNMFTSVFDSFTKK
jgi:hypothetical protein